MNTKVNEQFERYVTIRQHKSGAWQPLYVDARGTTMLPIHIPKNTKVNVEACAQYYALGRGLDYRAPQNDLDAAAADYDANGLRYVEEGTILAVYDDRIGD